MYYLGRSRYRDKVVYGFAGDSETLRRIGDVLVGVIGPFRDKLEMLLGAREFEKMGYTFGGMVPASLIKRYRQEGQKRLKKRYKRGIVGNPAISHRRALTLAKRIGKYARELVRHEGEGIRKKNPGEAYQYMKESDKFQPGTCPYNVTVAKAYEHLKSMGDSD